MNDYIVWYSDENNLNMFSEEFTLEQLINQDHLDIVSDSPLLKNFKVDSINNGIGLKDINGKNIYANCSIVEFIFYEGFKNNPHNKRALVGHFKLISRNPGYGIQVLNDDITCGFDFDDRMVDSIKIIDTIQENKLGLIK